MSSLTLLLQLLLLVSSVTAWSTRNKYRYYGGSMTFTSKGRNSDGTYEVVLRNKQTHFMCYQNGFSCSSGNCGSQISSVTGTVSANSYGLMWCHQEAVMTRKLSSNRPFEMRHPNQLSTHDGRGYWIGNIFSSRNYWRMTTHVDLGTRSDTGASNRSPITTTTPIIRVPQNCPRKFNLTVFDPDGDRVRCRYGISSRGECIFCGQPAGFSLDQNSCSLSYSHTSGAGLHPFELEVEDFPRKNITLSYSDGYYTTKSPLSDGRRRRAVSSTTLSPKTTLRYRSSIAALSKIPLQFSIQVDSITAPSCVDGEYFPIYLSPTPRNGENLPAYVNKILQIKVRAKALYSTIYGLIISGPKGIIKQKISTEEYIIKWTPTDNELNQHFPICFLFEARDKKNRIYHSELRCVIADVGHYETIVHCNDTSIKVEVEKSYLIRRNEANLHLRGFSDPNCNLSTLSNSTHLVAIMSLNTCGTTLEEDDDNLIFKNEITSADTTQIITRQHDVEIVFACVYPKRFNLTLGYKHKNPHEFREEGFGAFSLQFEFFESQLFRQQKDPNTYPVEVYLKQMIFMEIEATTSIPNTELFVESCKATPYDNPNSRVVYTIIENGCVRDKTVQIYPSSKSKFRFGMESFEFIGAHDEVYITCSVILCEMGVPGTRCSQGCIRSNAGHQRHRREATAQTARHSISQGPLHLIQTSDSHVSHPSLNLGMNVIFIVGCLLVCGALIYRSRRSKVKYQPLSTSDFN